MADIIQLGLSLDSSKVLTARDKANRALDSISRSSKRTQASVSKLQRGFGRLAGAAVAFVGIRQLTRGFTAMVEATKAGEQSAAKVNSVLRATEFAAGKTARAINQLSQAMADTTLFNDDEVRNLSAVLLTFKRVQGQVFDEAIGLIADMATVLGTDLKSAALQVGKALNDPVARLTDLSRAGITFTEQQKAMVRVMAEAGDMAGAQGVIIDELRNEFGGAAAGAQTGLFGSINSTKKAWDDFLEALGRTSVVQTAVGGFFDFMSKGLEMITPFRDELGLLRIELDFFETELERLNRGLPTLRRREKAEGTEAIIKDLKEQIKVIEEVAKAEEAAAEKAAEDALAAADLETSIALEREARLKASQNAAREWNEKQKALAAVWEKSWGRAIENTQDSFARFFKSLTTDGISSFEDFAKRALDIWLELSAQIAATKLFQAFLGTALGQGLTAGGRPKLMDIPTSLPAVGDPIGGELASVQPNVTINLSVSAIDAASFQVFADANKGTLANAVAQAAQESVAVRRAFRGR